MPIFQYVARNQGGALVRGQIEADSERSVRGKVLGLGYYPVSVSAQDTPSPLQISFLAGRVKSDDLVTFSWQLSAMMCSSLSIVEALAALEEETENATLKAAIGAIRKDIQDGESFSNAISRFPNLFPRVFVSLIRAGEVSGMLDTVLERLAIHLDKEHELRQRLKSAFAYPIVVALLSMIAVIFLLVKVVPTFATMYKSHHVELPLPTQILISASDLIAHSWWMLLLLGIGGAVAYWRVQQMPAYRPWLDSLLIRVPLFGKLNRKVAISRFMRTMSNMVGSGVPMLDALELSAEVAGNQVIRDAVEMVRQGVSEGEGLAVPMRRSGQFPALVVHMVRAGEETGSLDTMLGRIADFFDRDVDYAVRKVTSSLEPILTVAMGLVVGFIAVSMYLPIFSIAKMIHR